LTTELSLTITKGHGGGGTLDKKIIRGVYFSVDPPPPGGGGGAKIWPNNMLGEKNVLKGM